MMGIFDGIFYLLEKLPISFQRKKKKPNEIPLVFLWYPNLNEEFLFKGMPPRVGEWVEMGAPGDDWYGEYQVSEVIWHKAQFYPGWQVICKTEDFRTGLNDGWE